MKVIFGKRHLNFVETMTLKWEIASFLEVLLCKAHLIISLYGKLKMTTGRNTQTTNQTEVGHLNLSFIKWKLFFICNQKLAAEAIIQLESTGVLFSSGTSVLQLKCQSCRYVRCCSKGTCSGMCEWWSGTRISFSLHVLLILVLPGPESLTVT